MKAIPSRFKMTTEIPSRFKMTTEIPSEDGTSTPVTPPVVTPVVPTATKDVSQEVPPDILRVLAYAERPIGLQHQYLIPDARISASSDYGGESIKNNIRLNGTGAWSPANTTTDSFISFDLDYRPEIVAVATQGRNTTSTQWVKSYTLAYWDENGYGVNYNNGEILTGNTDRNTVVTKRLNPFKTERITLYPKTWNEYPSIRAEFYERYPTQAVVARQVGVEFYGKINDDAITASSFYNASTDPRKGRLNHTAAWAAARAAVGEWWQVDVGQVRPIARMAIQANPGTAGQWITTFKLKYSVNGTTWVDYKNGEILKGNSTKTDTKENDLQTFNARYIRVYPQTWQGFPVGRFEFYYEDTVDYNEQWVGVSNRTTVPDSWISASSEYGSSNRAANGRLNQTTIGWSPSNLNNSWWQIDMQRPKEIVGFITQGRSGTTPQWSKAISTILYSLDGQRWSGYQSRGQIPINYDSTTAVTTRLNSIKARYVRFYPSSTDYSGYITMRFELIERAIV